MRLHEAKTLVLTSLLASLVLLGCGAPAGDPAATKPAVPEGALWVRQAIRRDTPPQGYQAIVIWAQTATLKGKQAREETAFVTIDYWKMIEETSSGARTIYQEGYDQDQSRFSVDEAGLYVRYPSWFDLLSNDSHGPATNMRAEMGSLRIDVSMTPDRIVHWWMKERQLVRPGATYAVEIRLRVDGKAAVQLGSDYWRNLTIGYNRYDETCRDSNNCEAWVSEWIGDTGGEFLTVRVPVR